MSTADPERLPWLDPPRRASRAQPPANAGRRAQWPLFVVLALFLLAGVGMMSYLAGRGSMPAPVAATPEILPDERSATVTLPAAEMPPLPPPPPVEAQAPPPPPVREVVAERAAPGAKRTPARATAAPRTARVVKLRPSRRVLAARRALVQPQRVVHASKVVQLGAYRNRRYADAAYRRLVRVYPYLATLPKIVSATRPPRGYARSYRLQLKTHSPDHARILCQNLLSIGRGCVVLPVTARK